MFAGEDLVDLYLDTNIAVAADNTGINHFDTNIAVASDNTGINHDQELVFITSSKC